MNRKILLLMTKEEANRSLSYEDKIKWCEVHNATANLYVIRDGGIKDVPSEGWWY